MFIYVKCYTMGVRFNIKTQKRNRKNILNILLNNKMFKYEVSIFGSIYQMYV